MCDPASVDGANSREELPEDVPGSLLGKLFGEVDDPEQLAVLFDLHDVVEYPAYFAIGSAVDAPHIKIDNLNYVSMPGFCGHLDLVQKHLEDFLLVTAVELGLIDLVVHDLDGHAIICGEIDGQFYSKHAGSCTWRIVRSRA